MKKVYPLLIFLLTFFSCEIYEKPQEETPDDNGTSGGFVTDPITVNGGTSLNIVASLDIVSEITDISAKITGNFTQLDINEPIIKHGHIWSSINQYPDIDDQRTQMGSRTTTGQFISELTNLEPNTKYYVRAYVVTQNNRIGYHPTILTFTTINPPDPKPFLMFDKQQLISDNINNDNKPNPGETLIYNVTLSNTGDKDAANVIATFSSENSNVTFNQNNINFGNITTNGTQTKSVSITLSQNTPYDALIPINISIKDMENQNWAGNYDIQVYPLYVVMQNLVAYFRFNESNANSSVGSFSGNLTNVSFSTDNPDNSGNSSVFAGNSYISVYGLPNATAFTINAWIKLTSGGAIFGTGNSYSNRVVLEGNNVKVGQYITFNIGSTHMDGQWHMLTITIGRPNSGSTLTKYYGYVDGVFKGANSNYSLEGLFDFAGMFTIGANSDVGGMVNFVNGKIDNYRFYNKILSESEILEIYNARQ